MTPLRAHLGGASPPMVIARMHGQPGGALPQRGELGTATGRFSTASQPHRPAGSGGMCRAEAQHLGAHVRAGLRPRRAVRARQSSIAPNMPLPGDDQAAMIFSALSEAEGAAASAPRGTGGDAASSSNGAGLGVRAGGVASTSSSGGGGGPEDQPQRIPHRWRVVGMMALAFVLCNMDKARRAPARASCSGCVCAGHVCRAVLPRPLRRKLGGLHTARHCQPSLAPLPARPPGPLACTPGALVAKHSPLRCNSACRAVHKTRRWTHPHRACAAWPRLPARA